MALTGLLSGVFGTRHERERKRVQPIVDEINEHYARLQTVSDEELRAQTAKFRERIREVTGEIETRIADLREKKKTTADPAAREAIDNELSGVDGRGGAEATGGLSTLSGCAPAGTKISRSRSRASRASAARRRCPTWGGSNVPPNTPMRTATSPALRALDRIADALRGRSDKPCASRRKDRAHPRCI